MKHEEWTTSHSFTFWRFNVIVHKRAYWGNLLTSWGLNNSGGTIFTPFGGIYFI